MNGTLDLRVQSAVTKASKQLALQTRDQAWVGVRFYRSALVYALKPV